VIIQTSASSEKMPSRTSLLENKPFLNTDSFLVLLTITLAIWQMMILTKNAVTAFEYRGSDGASDRPHVHPPE